MLSTHPSHRALHRRFALLAVIAVVATFFAGPALAEDRWQLYAFATSSSTGDGFSFRDDDGSVADIDASTAPGFGVGLDYRLSKRLSLGAAYMRHDFDLDLGVTIDGIGASVTTGFDVGIFTFGLDVDLTSPGGFALTIGPAIAWIDYDDVLVDLPSLGAAGTLTFDDEVALGVRLRAEIPIGNWRILAGIEFYGASAEDKTRNDFDLDVDVEMDPTIVSLGVGYRF